jgi:hypothetical protein
MNIEYGCLLEMVEKGADEIIHRVYIYIIIRQNKTKNQKIKTKKKLLHISFVSKLSVLFSRVTPHDFVVAPIILNEMARELHITIIQMYTTKLYIYIYRNWYAVCADVVSSILVSPSPCAVLCEICNQDGRPLYSRAMIRRVVVVCDFLFQINKKVVRDELGWLWLMNNPQRH